MTNNALNHCAKKWGSKYAYAIKCRNDNWDDLAAYFDYPRKIPLIIYTRNAIEILNSNIRK
jgi:transposase-like protein